MNLAQEAHRIITIAQSIVFRPDATLTLLSYEQSVGETSLLSLTDGWIAQRGTDNSTTSVSLWVTDRDEMTLALMNTVSRFTIEDTTYRVIQGGITPPSWEPKLWQIQGEEIRNQVEIETLVAEAIVSGAGTIAANGIYTARGTQSGKPYYNLLGQPNDPGAYSIVYTGSVWSITGEPIGGLSYYVSPATVADFPWLVTFAEQDGDSPAPTVSEG